MRRLLSLAGAVAAALLVLAAVPASASVNAGAAADITVTSTTTPADVEWIRVPHSTFDQAAGVTCDFPIHGEALVDEVVKLVLETFPDGSVKREYYTGALVVRVTNTTTGASIDVDASGSGPVEYQHGSPGFTSESHGPILLGMREGLGSLPRGLYVPNGEFTLTVSDSGFRTVKWKINGGAFDVCAAIS